MPTTPERPLRHRNLALLLLQARDAVMARFRPMLASHGVTEQQWRIVRELVTHGPLEPREIGARCCLSSPSLAGVLARMDELGLVTRQRLDTDLRRVRVQATPQARALARRMAPAIEQIYRELEADLGADFVARLYDTADTLIARIGPAHGARRPDPRRSRPAQARQPTEHRT